MITSNKKNSLRLRAETLLKKRKDKTSSDQDIYQIVEELNLYQIELELQNEDLIQAQLDLQVSHKKYADLYNLAPIPYFTFNSEGLIVDVNQAGLDLLGMKKQTLINRCFSRYIVPEFQALFSQCRKRALNENSAQTCELKLLRWRGPAFDAYLECKIIQDLSEEKPQLLVCITDITHRKLAEKSLHLQQIKIASIDKMRSMNEQIYSIAHHQNHALTVIDNYIYGCIHRLEAKKHNFDELLQPLRKVAQQSRMLTNIILQMKNATSKTVFRYETINVNTVITEALSLINYETVEFPISVYYESIDNFPSIKVDKLHIQQVLLNLARNSIEAMRDANTNEPKLLIELHLINNMIEITMFDNGPGFDKNITASLFEPYFTTKSYAIGLGLAVSRTIIEKHGGQLTAQVNPKGGAFFQLTLPVSMAKNPVH